LYRRLPKLKGFQVYGRKAFTLVNVEDLAELKAKSEVSLESLMAAGIITQNDGPLKVLGNGELTVSLTVKAAGFTEGARSKIEAAGGTCETV
jgi:large subunit ribosomal protein L15